MHGLYLIQMQRHGQPLPYPADQPRLPLTFADGKLSVWSSEPVLTLGSRGCLIGHLFSRKLPYVRMTELSAEAIDRICQTGGKSLLEEYWGAYVLVLTGRDGSVSVFRDPSGMLPCFSRHADGAVRFSSSCPLLLTGQKGDAIIDYVELARFLQNMDAVGHGTVLHSINEVLAGTAIIIGPGGVATESWWSPWDHCSPHPGKSRDEQIAMLKTVILGCTTAWSTCFERLIIGVSGGLDSSIVAACMKTAGAGVRTLTMAGADLDGDERDYAGLLADYLDVPLTTCLYEEAELDIAKSVLPHLPWPIGGQFAHAVMAVHARMNEDVAIDALFSGNGGDNVFCSVHSASPLVDRLMVEGLGKGCWQTLTDLNRLTGASMKDVLGATWRRYRRRHQGLASIRDDSGLSDKMLRRLNIPVPLHPWLKAPPGMPPGKTAHVAMVTRAQKMLEYYPREMSIPHIAPLLSQPIIELCLSIPTWAWIEGGVNRAPARAAFRELLPEAITRRLSKGGPTGYLMQLRRRHAQMLEEMLQGGLLMEHGLLDSDFLARSYDPTPAGTAWAQRILSFAVAETWARWWTSSSRDPLHHYWPAADASSIRAQSS